MHTLAVQLAPVLAAEKSKVPFYIAGGLLVVWALGISLGSWASANRSPEGFPGPVGDLDRHDRARARGHLDRRDHRGHARPSRPTAAGTRPPPAPPLPTRHRVARPPPPRRPPPTAPDATTPGTPPRRARPAPSAAGRPRRSLLAANTGGQLAYNTKQLSAKAGTVTIDFANASPLEHNVTIAQARHGAGRDADVHRRVEVADADAEARHLHVLLLGARAPSGGHGRYAEGLVKLYVCWGTFPTVRPGRAPLCQRLPRAQGRGLRPRGDQVLRLRAAARGAATARAAGARFRS